MRHLLLPFVVLIAACSSAARESEPGLDELDTGGAGVADASTTTSDTEFVIDAPAVTDTASTCVRTEPVESACNAIDDDCNGAIDDVDLGKDGICDCLGILILGSSGGYASSSFEAWLKAKGTTARRRLDSAGGPLIAAHLAGVDVVILDRLSRDYTSSEIDVIEAFVKDGGGLVSMTGYDHSGADATRPNGILRRFGVLYNTSIRPNAPVTKWDATHPISKGITSVTFLGGYGVSTLAGFETTTVALTMGSSAGVAAEFGSGRAFAWGDEWIEYDSEWKTIPEIPKLWANIFGWVAQRRCGGTIQ